MIKNRFILVIGGSNVDITGISGGTFIESDSNPGKITMSAGGVGRNIAENLARLGMNVFLLTAIGGDSFGSFILKECKNAGINMEFAEIFDNASSSTYAAIMDDRGDLAAAVSDMEITSKIDSALLEKHRELIESAEIVITDNNINPETLGKLMDIRDGNILFDAVSGRKLSGAMDVINGINAVKLNSIEAGILAGIEVENPADAKKAADIITERNIDNIFITMGSNGSMYTSRAGRWLRKPELLCVSNSTGAGDAFMAGIAYGMFNGRSGAQLLQTASICASFAASSEKTVPENLTSGAVEKIFQGETK